MAYTQDSVIATDGVETVGNSANRFDTWRQSTTLGPMPPTADEGPPEQASGGNTPKAG